MHWKSWQICTQNGTNRICLLLQADGAHGEQCGNLYLVRDDRLEKLEAILRRDWNLVKRMYGDMWKMDLQNEKERYRFLQLLTEIEWYLEGKG